MHRERIYILSMEAIFRPHGKGENLGATEMKGIVLLLFSNEGLEVRYM